MQTYNSDNNRISPLTSDYCRSILNLPSHHGKPSRVEHRETVAGGTSRRAEGGKTSPVTDLGAVEYTVGGENDNTYPVVTRILVLTSDSLYSSSDSLYTKT